MSYFIDETIIKVVSGTGGDGCISFRREKYVPLGGPDGGDGGRGGDVILVGDENLTSLMHLRYKKIYEAESGKHGSGKNRYGKKGEDLIIRLPVGSLIRSVKSGEIIGDIIENGQQIVIAKGGKGGKGNAKYVTSTNQAPRRADSGGQSEELDLKLELKLLADVGIIGFPNAGKSTLISTISAARPRIADYPFTTLVPNLGVVNYQGDTSFVVADIPGIIEGAHKGAGLGLKFLKHIERTKILVHLIDASLMRNENPLEDYVKINHELKAFDPELASKPQIVALNKADITPEKELKDTESNFRSRGIDVITISAVTGVGLDVLLSTIVKKLGMVQKKTTENNVVAAENIPYG